MANAKSAVTRRSDILIRMADGGFPDAESPCSRMVNIEGSKHKEMAIMEGSAVSAL
jgi:hypothetical protein